MHIFTKEQFLWISYKDKEMILGLQGKRLGKANKKQTEGVGLAQQDGGDSSGAISRPAGTKVVFSLCLEGGAEYLSLFVNLCSSFGSTEGRQQVLPSAAPQLSSTEQTPQEWGPFPHWRKLQEHSVLSLPFSIASTTHPRVYSLVYSHRNTQLQDRERFCSLLVPMANSAWHILDAQRA